MRGQGQLKKNQFKIKTHLLFSPHQYNETKADTRGMEMWKCVSGKWEMGNGSDVPRQKSRFMRKIMKMPRVAHNFKFFGALTQEPD